MAVLITGGAGFIGSHTAVELLNAGKEIVIADNFVNSNPAVLNRIKKITGRDFKFYEVDCCLKDNLKRIFEENNIDSIIHFAGLKAVGESVQKPLRYYENNLISTLSLCGAAEEYGCKTIVFSSSATVYGSPKAVPVKEDFPLKTTNPYGSTKLINEMILKDLYVSDNDWRVVLLRYFNPIGAHKSGLLGESPNGIPNNLMPYINKVAVKKLPFLSVFGNDYETKDGTGVRDYIHVVDLAYGHLCALDYALHNKGVEVFNLGTGRGYSVLEVVTAFEKASSVKIPIEFAPRRKGDIAEIYADPSKSKAKLGWTAKYSIDRMCADCWNFTVQNPNGIE